MKAVMSSGNLDTYEINDSLTEDALWINANVGEAIPDVFTPLTWSIVRALDDEATIFPGYYTWSGNICGRVYTNISRRLSAMTTLRGWDARRSLNVLGDVFGHIPEQIDIPTHRSSRWSLMRVLVLKGVPFFLRYRRASNDMPRFLETTPGWCRRMTSDIGAVQTREALLKLWTNELGPYTSRAWWALLAGTGTVFMSALGLNERLAKLAGAEDANALLANFRGDSELASLGPVAGIARVARGEMAREEYLLRYGHRGPHEFELSIPHPAENREWLERQIEEFAKSPRDVDSLLREQRSRHEDALKRLGERFPQEAKELGRQLPKIAAQARIKEASRSEFTRVLRVVRAFALRAGELTGTGNGAFFLYLNEVLDLLAACRREPGSQPARPW